MTKEQKMSEALDMMYKGVSQREISLLTGLNRNSIRELATRVGFQFPRNGIEILGKVCMCMNCGIMFRRPASKVYRAENNFCDPECQKSFQRGPNHPGWKDGRTLRSFSTWIQNQSEYKQWKEQALARAGYVCEITGQTGELDVHHIFPKGTGFNPEKALDPSNSCVMLKKLHHEIHELIRQKVGFEEAVVMMKEKYGNK